MWEILFHSYKPPHRFENCPSYQGKDEKHIVYFWDIYLPTLSELNFEKKVLKQNEGCLQVSHQSVFAVYHKVPPPDHKSIILRYLTQAPASTHTSYQLFYLHLLISFNVLLYVSLPMDLCFLIRHVPS